MGKSKALERLDAKLREMLGPPGKDPVIDMVRRMSRDNASPSSEERRSIRAMLREFAEANALALDGAQKSDGSQHDAGSAAAAPSEHNDHLKPER